MKSALRFWHVFLVLLLLPLLMSTLVYATGDVTFQVKLSVQILEGHFNPATDSVFVAGTFQPGSGWDPRGTVLTYNPVDSVATTTYTGITEGSIQYKFITGAGASSNWESISNRSYTVVTGPQTLPLVYFNNDSVFSPSGSVTFQVNMRIQAEENNFDPLTDTVFVAGDFQVPSWNASNNPLVLSLVDTIARATIPNVTAGYHEYKFIYGKNATRNWEGIGNRNYTVVVGSQTVPVAYFNNDSVYRVAITANILFQVNMNPYEELGLFRPDLGDSMEIRGQFNGWGGGSMMTEDPFNPGVYTYNLPYSGQSNDQIQYKYRMKLDSAQAVIRFPGYGGNQDGVAYDHPYGQGDGNRIYNVGFGGNRPLIPEYFSSIGPCGEIPAGDSVTITAQVNMGPASRYIIPFTLGTDSLWLFYQDALSWFTQINHQGSNFPANGYILMTQAHDSIYTGTWTITGPANFAIMYNYSFKQAGPSGSSYTESGGLGGQDIRRSRFIARADYNHSVRNYTMPLDTWQPAAPYPEEVASCGPKNYQMCDGWNMVSVPESVASFSSSILFQWATGSLFEYNNGYVPVSVLSNGPGYWAKFRGAQTNSYFGYDRVSADIPIVMNWNMIGSINASVPAGNITSTPDSIVISPYFGYACGSGYFPSASVDGGAAYWVRAKSNGTLHLTTPPLAAAKNIAAVDETKKLNKLTIQDQGGHQQVLFFSIDGIVDPSRYEMPPKPPQGAFDVRYGSGQMLATVGVNQMNTFPISISSSSNTVKVSWDLNSSSVSASLGNGTKIIELKKNGTAIFSSSDLKLVLTGTRNDALLPKVYALQQNYPNPFNPTTSIRYELPADSKVNVKIYDIMGNEVKTLVDQDQEAGYKTIEWNSTNNAGNIVATGVYFYRITATNLSDASKSFVDTKKMMLLK